MISRSFSMLQLDPMEKMTTSLEETFNFAQEIILTVIKDHKGGRGALVVGLFGDLGSGKTSFTQGVAQALGIKDQVISPTFILQRIYKVSVNNFTHFVHIDCYRLEEKDEIKTLGWDGLIKNPHNIILVEWAGKIEHVLPPHTKRVFFEFIDEHKRKITLDDNKR